ncbi:hypothetical protein N7931_13245 [Catenovulum sp. 2E275]|uniref:DUF6559 family protein n=1 Tax=Catenovulum sp. 2E275 TaxID=2980497 RepID=UPI0021CE36B4|nr:DUF6559 family protein [Catenovulum sp. 2E275]MCU4676597.1 hypothetical protein [Catenovulum sp. 2E275]
MFERYTKNKAIKQYHTKLYKCLIRDYGKSFGCNKKQIISSIKRHKLNEKYSVYALAMYLDKEIFCELITEASSEQIFKEIKTVVDPKPKHLKHENFVHMHRGYSLTGLASGGD